VVSWRTRGLITQADVADALEELKKPGTAPGQISFAQPSLLLDWWVMLFSILRFPDDVPEGMARDIARSSVFRVGASGRITAERVIAEVNRRTEQYRRRPVERYVLVTSVSIPREVDLQSYRLGNVWISFRRNLPQRFVRYAEETQKRAAGLLKAERPKRYRPVRVHASGRSPVEAGETALRSLNYLRGMWNWYHNGLVAMRFGGGMRPVNRVLLGPVHSLHHLDGKPADGRWWYEPSYRWPELWPIRENHISGSEKWVRTVRDRMRGIPYAKELREAIARYGIALDEYDLNVAFLKLWGVYEDLTYTKRRDTSEVSARRASFIFQEHTYYKDFLRYLTDCRNDYVHGGVENKEMGAHVYRFKFVVETLLEFHLARGRQYGSIREVAELLDRSVDEDVLKREIALRQRAVKFIGHSG